MKIKFLLIILLISVKGLYAQFDHQNINLLGIFNDSTVLPEPVYGIRYQACWGWADSINGKEYGIIGSTAGTYIIDVTDPVNMVQVDYVPHHQSDCIWHEYKTFGNYLYIISDDAGNNSLQIADLSYLPDSVHVVYDSTDIFIHAHTLFIDRDKLYVGIVTTATNQYSMNVYSLSNPAHPTLLRSLNQDYPLINGVHDMYVSNDTVYASCGYDGLFIFRYDTTLNQFFLLGTLQDGFNIYNHSSFLSKDHKTLYMCEEVPDGQPVKIVDVNNINIPTLVDTFYSHSGATPHNPSVKDDMLIIAYYQDGVYIYNVSNPVSPALLGFFDTYPANSPGTYPQPAYAGCWSTYHELPSGTLLASDMQSGLFCLDISNITGIGNLHTNNFNVYPNPANEFIKIIESQNYKIEIIDLNGKVCISFENTASTSNINIASLNDGIYFIRITKKENVSISRFVKIKD